MATKKSQRIAIWVITIVMAIGTLGAYFIVILANSNDKRDQADVLKQLQENRAKDIDPTAHKVEGDVTELKVEDLKVGEGAEVKVGDKIRVQYKGTFAQTGAKLDSSYERGEPAELTLKEGTETQEGVIKGWVEGIAGMKEGGKRRLIIPSEKAYGDKASEAVPANSDLVFEVELLKVNP